MSEPAAGGRRKRDQQREDGEQARDGRHGREGGRLVEGLVQQTARQQRVE